MACDPSTNTMFTKYSTPIVSHDVSIDYGIDGQDLLQHFNPTQGLLLSPTLASLPPTHYSWSGSMPYLWLPVVDNHHAVYQRV